MSIAITGAFAAIKARADAQISLPMRWPDDPAPLPDEPAPFVHFEIISGRGRPIEIGAGRGSNTHRKYADLNAYVFVPVGTGLEYALSLAEPVAAAFRSYKGGGVSFEGADVYPIGEGSQLVPPGLQSAAGNYSCAGVSASFYFDQLG